VPRTRQSRLKDTVTTAPCHPRAADPGIHFFFLVELSETITNVFAWFYPVPSLHVRQLIAGVDRTSRLLSLARGQSTRFFRGDASLFRGLGWARFFALEYRLLSLLDLIRQSISLTLSRRQTINVIPGRDPGSRIWRREGGLRGTFSLRQISSHAVISPPSTAASPYRLGQNDSRTAVTLCKSNQSIFLRKRIGYSGMGEDDGRRGFVFRFYKTNT
jgi:hypothetical protein